VTAAASTIESLEPGWPRTLTGFVGRLAVLVFPAFVLALGGWLAGGEGLPVERAWLLWLGALLVGVTALMLAPQSQLTAPSTGLAVVALYVLAQVWLWYCIGPMQRHWYPHFAVGALLAVPIVIFAGVALTRSGVRDLRRARLAAEALRARRDWPRDLSFAATLPEVAELRSAIASDAAPALALLDDERPGLRVAALSALAYRRHWGPGQADVVRQLAEKVDVPEVRAAAARALAYVRERQPVETLAQFLRDRSPLVRRAVAEVLFWEGERRWPWVRFGVHEALADPNLRGEGPLPLAGATLPPQAVADLADWSGEGGVQGVRAAATLSAYFDHLLSAGPDERLADEIRGRVLDPQAPTVLRLELAQLLLQHRLLDGGPLAELLGPEQPVPLRLLAANETLAAGRDPTAIAALYEIARRPNREIALAVAEVVQRRLGVDLGVRQPLPPVQSRLAAEIARRVMDWATQTPPDSDIVIPSSPATESAETPADALALSNATDD
jgi:hypothetical protein